MRSSNITTANVTDIAKRATELPPRAGAGGVGAAGGAPPRAIPRRSPSSGMGGGAAPTAAMPKRSPSTGGAAKKASPAASSVHQPKMSSSKLDPNRFANPFDTNTRKCKTGFSSAYVNGSIPCRLQTTASRYFLQWEKGAETGFSPDLLAVCADGLVETDHPYVVMAPMMFAELCHRSEGCLDLFPPQVIETIAGHIRTALMAAGTPGASAAVKSATSAGGAGCGTGVSIFEGALKALAVFLENTGNLMLPYLAKYIIPALARPFQDRTKREAVGDALRLIEAQCGPEATKIIKAKIPTY